MLWAETRHQEGTHGVHTSNIGSECSRVVWRHMHVASMPVLISTNMSRPIAFLDKIVLKLTNKQPTIIYLGNFHLI